MSTEGQNKPTRQRTVKPADHDVEINLGLFKLTAKGRVGFYFLLSAGILIFMAFIAYLIVLAVTGSDIPTINRN